MLRHIAFQAICRVKPVILFHTYVGNDMEGKGRLILTNALSLLVVLAALAAGWRQEALFGLAVLAVMDLIVMIRHRLGRRNKDGQE